MTRLPGSQFLRPLSRQPPSICVEHCVQPLSLSGKLTADHFFSACDGFLCQAPSSISLSTDKWGIAGVGWKGTA